MKTPAPIEDPDRDPRAATPLRLASLAAVALVFVLYEPGAPASLLNTLLLPVLGAVATWFLTRSVLVIAFGTLCLAGAHVNFGSPSVLESLVYPACAAIGGLATAVICIARFRRAMAERSAQRRAARDAAGTSSGDKP